MHEIIDKAIDDQGSQSALARSLSKFLKKKIWQSHISSWKKSKKGVPPEYCHALSKITGISKKRLRPDIYGSPNA